MDKAGIFDCAEGKFGPLPAITNVHYESLAMN